MALTKVDIKDVNFNPFTAIGKQWMLVSAGNETGWNTMTANWGGVGIMWMKPTATTYIRHSRFTKEFIDKNEYFTLTFLKDGHRDALNVLGSKSGRDMDKMGESGLTPIMLEGQPTFEEAELVLICKKKSKTEIFPEDILESEILDKWYADKDYHTMYLGEIVAAYEGE